MEYKYPKTAFFYLCIFILGSCGYFENDQTDFQKRILGNVMIQKQENSKEFHLVFAESEEIYPVVIENCESVFFDSTDSIIFVESFANKFHSNFYQIKVIDPSSKTLFNGLKKEKIREDTFLNRTKALVPQLP
jgi:hypothetical protein